jgi:hypothetical protein
MVCANLHRDCTSTRQEEERHLKRRLFGAVVWQIATLPVPTVEGVVAELAPSWDAGVARHGKDE